MRHFGLWRRMLRTATQHQLKLPTCRFASSCASSVEAKAAAGRIKSHGNAGIAPVMAADDSAPVNSSSRKTQNAVDTIVLLEKSITQRLPTQALSYFDRLDTAPSQEIAQKVAVLVAKQGTSDSTRRAVEILRNSYMQPGLVPDDYTKLASIYVVDACLRHNMLDEALEMYEEALNAGVVLDLPAYDALLKALVDADRLDDAVEILREITAEKDISPTAQTYFPMLLALMQRCDYTAVVDLIKHGRSRGIVFTLEIYDPLVELGEEQEENPDNIDGLEMFMAYVNKALDEDGLMTDFDEDDITIEYDDSDDQDDDDDGSFDNEFDDDDEFN